MRKIVSYTFIIILTIISQSFFFETNNHKAIRFFEKDINLIENCLKGKPTKADELLRSINTVEKITGITSEAGADFFGRRFYPTVNDISRWRGWLKLNKNRLMWDSKMKQVYLKVEKVYPGKYYEV